MRRPARLEDRAVPGLLLVGRLLAGESLRHPPRPAHHRHPQRHQRPARGVLRRPVPGRARLRRRQPRLDGAVPQGLRDPERHQPGRQAARLRRRPAQPVRVQPAGPVAPRQRGRPASDDEGLRLRRQDDRQAFLRRVHEPVHARLRLYLPGRGAGYLRPDHPALRATWRLEPRPAVGRRHDRGAGVGDLRTQDRADREPQPAGGRASAAAARSTGTPWPSAARPRRAPCSTCSATASTAKIAEASFTSASAGSMPAGSVLFANTPANVGGVDRGRSREPACGSSGCSTAAKPADDAARRGAADRGPREHRRPGHQRHDAQPAADLRVRRHVRVDDRRGGLAAECRGRARSTASTSSTTPARTTRRR